MARPKIPILSTTLIADAALALVDATGQLQMVQLAERLGVAPSSLYNHVKNRTEVVDLARLRMLESMEPAAPVEGWRAGVEWLLRLLTRNYAAHPRMLPLIFGHTIASERTIAIYEPVFVALLDAGFTPDQLRLVIALIDFQAMGLAQGLPEPLVTDHIRSTLPAYTASIDHSRYNRDTSTDFSARVLVEGLAAILETNHSTGPQQR